MDASLKNRLWNLILKYFLEPSKEDSLVSNCKYSEIFEDLWDEFFKEKIDEIPRYTSEATAAIRDRFDEWKFFEVYDFIEFISRYFRDLGFIESCNIILEKEVSAYRFVDGVLAPIYSDIEVSQIEEAIDIVRQSGVPGVEEHLKQALVLLADKNNPDYRNSIKESISGLEGFLRSLSGKSKFSDAINHIGAKHNLHESLKQGYIKLYGYSSDGDGIRHPIMYETNLEQEDAIYFLVICSALINLLSCRINRTE